MKKEQTAQLNNLFACSDTRRQSATSCSTPLGARRERSREPAQSRDDQFNRCQSVAAPVGSGGATLTWAEDNPDGDAATFGAVRARAPA